MLRDLTFDFKAKIDLTDYEIQIVLAGGRLRLLKKQLEEMKEAENT